MSRGPHARFRLAPEVIEAMDLARGKEPRQAYVDRAVLLRLALDGYRIEQPGQRACVECGAMFTAVRVTARYCSAACRTYASRRAIAARQGEEGRP